VTAFVRGGPPPPLPIPPSAALLHPVGSLQDAEGGEALSDLDGIASDAGIVGIELWPLIHAGVDAGYLLVDEDDAVSLSERGWAWYRRDSDR